MECRPRSLSPETAQRIRRRLALLEAGDPETVARVQEILNRPHPELDRMQQAIDEAERLTEKDFGIRFEPLSE